MKLRGGTKTIVAALFGITMLGLVAVPSGATTPAVPIKRRITTRVPLVLGPAPAHPTLVAAAPKVLTPGLQAQSVNSTFIVNYDAGFNANPAAKAAFQYAVDQWANVISSTVPIEVDASFADLGNPNILGGAGPNTVFRDFSGAPRAGTFYPSALANALHGSDLDPSGSDIGADFSSTFTGFYFGTDGNTAGKIDFASVVLHELGHGLGFLGVLQVNLDGTGSRCCLLDSPLIYDRYTTANGTPILSIPNGSTALGNALQGQTLRFTGPQATALNGGTAPRLYGPNPWQGGSSYSHLDESTFPAGNVNSLMTPAIGADEVIHAPGPVTLGVFADSGWTVAGLPVLSIAAARVVEGNADSRTLRFNVSLSSPAAYPVTFTYQSAAGTAASPADFANRSGIGTIAAGATSTTVNIAVWGDTTVEAMEKLTVRIFGVSGATIGAQTAPGYILDDDLSTNPRVAVGSASIVEGTTGIRKVRLSITLSKKSPGPVSVQWATGTGTATVGVDYTAASGTVSFPAGVTDRAITVDVLPDAIAEPNDYFSVTLTNPIGAALQRSVGFVTINNDD